MITKFPQDYLVGNRTGKITIHASVGQERPHDVDDDNVYERVLAYRVLYVRVLLHVQVVKDVHEQLFELLGVEQLGIGVLVGRKPDLEIWIEDQLQHPLQILEAPLPLEAQFEQNQIEGPDVVVVADQQLPDVPTIKGSQFAKRVGQGALLNEDLLWGVRLKLPQGEGRLQETLCHSVVVLGKERVGDSVHQWKDQIIQVQGNVPILHAVISSQDRSFVGHFNSLLVSEISHFLSLVHAQSGTVQDIPGQIQSYFAAPQKVDVLRPLILPSWASLSLMILGSTKASLVVLMNLTSGGSQEPFWQLPWQHSYVILPQVLPQRFSDLTEEMKPTQPGIWPSAAMCCMSMASYQDLRRVQPVYPGIGSLLPFEFIISSWQNYYSAYKLGSLLLLTRKVLTQSSPTRFSIWCQPILGLQALTLFGEGIQELVYQLLYRSWAR